MPPIFPENNTPALRLSKKPDIEAFRLLQSRWNAYGRKGVPLSLFRDQIVGRKEKRIGAMKRRLLADCYTLFLPYLGANYLTQGGYFSDRKAEFWRQLDKRDSKEKPKIKIKQMPSGFQKVK